MTSQLLVLIIIKLNRCWHLFRDNICVYQEEQLFIGHKGEEESQRIFPVKDCKRHSLSKPILFYHVSLIWYITHRLDHIDQRTMPEGKFFVRLLTQLFLSATSLLWDTVVCFIVLQANCICSCLELYLYMLLIVFVRALNYICICFELYLSVTSLCATQSSALLCFKPMNRHGSVVSASKSPRSSQIIHHQ